MSHDIYLDYSATTPADRRVLEAMWPYFSETFGNTSSVHRYGRDAEDAVEKARETVAHILNCTPGEIVFTSGGSESDNLAVRGAAWRYRGRGNHLVTTPTEHPAVSKTVAQLADTMGFTQTILPVDKTGRVDVADFANACTSQTVLASIVYANNEIGTVSPLPQLAKCASEKNVLLHTDAVQAAGQVSLDVGLLGVAMMSLSAHKFYGPKGIGALYIRNGVELASNQTGGSHEGGNRAGTLNTPGIVGLAAALQIAYDEFESHVAHYKKLRDMLIEGILSRVSGVELSGHPTQRLPSHASFVFEGIDTNTLLMHLDMRGIAASGGSACKAGNPTPSNVLLAMGFSSEKALGGLRLTVGRPTTESDIAYTIEALAELCPKLRTMSQGVSSP